MLTLKMTRRTSTLSAFTLLVAASVIAPQFALAAPVTPTPVSGNPTCQEYGYAYGFKPQSGGGDFTTGQATFSLPNDPNNTVTVNSDGTYFDWSSTLGIDAVIAKGGNGANIYTYDPESKGDTHLVSPNNASGGPAELSHVIFCYDYEVNVSKTANTSYTRTWGWTIGKAADADSLLLSAGQSHTVNYEVTVGATSTDSQWAAQGVITIVNPDPTNPARISSVADVISTGISAAVNCGGSFPYTIAPGATLLCDYTASLPDGASRVNTATVGTAGDSKVGGGSGTAAVDFGAPTTEIDEVVNVTDDKYTFPEGVGQIHATSTPFPTSLTYALAIQHDQCGDYSHVNTATFTATDTGATGSASKTVAVKVEGCDDPEGDEDIKGCTLTQGYWKTHSEQGPAPYDDNWAKLPQQSATLFYLSGASWHGVFWTAPKGNAYYNLAHQYMAAKLNVLNGASSTPAVDNAMAFAETWFATKSPAVKLTKSQSADLVSNAGILGGYNEGRAAGAPLHCSE